MGPCRAPSGEEQNDGKLAKRRREKEFAALTDDEVIRIEQIYREVFAEEAN